MKTQLNIFTIILMLMFYVKANVTLVLKLFVMFFLKKTIQLNK